METLLFTIEKRPYVFIFLVAFLVIGCLTRGWKRTFIFLFSGYLIAWGSEALSIRTGFPYGWYFYIYENLKGEWMNCGVPVWDSLSYTFLSFAGLSVAEYLLNQSSKKLILFKTAFLSAFLVMLLDIIIDPLAHLGDRWFLGKIYYYPNPGWYFNVPLSNFIGWFFVTALIVGVNPPRPPFAKGGLGGIFLYFGIFLFNFGITLWIKEWTLVLLDLMWISLPLGLIIFKYKSQSRDKANRAGPEYGAPRG